MNIRNIITMKENESGLGVAHAYAIPDPLFAESNDQNLLGETSFSTCPTLNVHTKSLAPSGSQPGSSMYSNTQGPELEPDNPLSCVSHPQHKKPMFSRFSSFCPSLFSTSLTTLESHKQLRNIQFLPDPPKCNQLISVGPFFNSPIPLSRHMGDHWDERNHLEDMMQAFLKLPGDALDGSFHGNYGCKNFAFAEQLDFENFSEELVRALNSNGKSPLLDEIYEMPQVSFVPEVGSKSQSHELPVPPVGIPMHPSPSASAATVVNKTRMSWTLDLHDLFVEAVNILGGPDKATPKAILKEMNADDLTIYQIKSHLQKYRLERNRQSTKEENKASSSKGERVVSTSNEDDSSIKGFMQVTEALRMQVEVQKRLHEHLEEQRALQLRIEDNARWIAEHSKYLKMVLDDHQKGGNRSISDLNQESLPHNLPSSEPGLESSSTHASVQQAQSRTDTSSSIPAKQKAAELDIESKQPTQRKKARTQGGPEIAPH